MYCTIKKFAMVVCLEYKGGGGVFIVNKGRESCIPFEKFLYWIVAKGTLFFFTFKPSE